MVGLEKITSRIIADAKADAEKSIAAAEEQCRAIKADCDARIATMSAAIGDEAERDAENMISRAKSTAAMDKRNILMAAHSRLVDDAFAEAREKILNMSGKEYTAFVVSLLSAAFFEQAETEKKNRELYGDEEAGEIAVYEVILNENDRAKFGRDIIGGAKNQLAGKVEHAMVEKLALSESTAEIDGGVILKYGDVEINCSLSVMLSGLRNELESEVCRVLFG